MDLEFNPMCRRKKHSYSTEIHWCSPGYLYWSGCVARKAHWLLECRFEQKSVRFLDRIPEVHSMSRLVSLLREKCGHKNSSSYHIRECVPEVWTKIGDAAQKREKQEWVMEKHKIDNARRLRGIYFMIRMMENTKETIKTAEKIGSSDGVCYPSQKKGQCQKHTHRVRLKKLNGEGLCPDQIPKTKYVCIEEAHKSTRQRLAIFASQKSWRQDWRQRKNLNHPQQFGS